MKRLPRTRWLIVSGLLVLIIGYIVPAQFPLIRTQGMYQIYSESIDIKLILILGKAVSVTVKFESDVDPSLCEVWRIVTYQYPTKSIGETLESLRFRNQLEVDFVLQ